MELLAYRSYRECDYAVRFWRTRSGLECDFVLGREGEVAIEVNGSANPGPGDLRAIRAYVRDHCPRLAVVVCNTGAPRRTLDGIDILPLGAVSRTAVGRRHRGVRRSQASERSERSSAVERLTGCRARANIAVTEVQMVLKEPPRGRRAPVSLTPR